MEEIKKISITDARRIILNSGKNEILTGYDLKDDESGELNPNYDFWYSAWKNEQELSEKKPDYTPCIKMIKREKETEFMYNSNGDSGFEAVIIFDENNKKSYDNILNESSLITYIGTSMDADGTISVMDKDGKIYSEETLPE